MPLSVLLDIQLLTKSLQNFKNQLNGQTDEKLSNDVQLILNVLQCPVFGSIINIKESLDHLKNELSKHPSILPLDFDILR